MHGERTKILTIQRCGSDIVTIRMESPPGYSFRAGQWFRMTLAARDGLETRTFSHAAAPGDGWIELTTRFSPSAFKQALAALEPGDEVEITAPGGRFALPGSQDTFAFLVGGVGITPVRGLLRDAAQTGRAFEDALLVYGNRDASCEPYLEELAALAPIGVRLVRVLEHVEGDWAGETGLVTAELVRRYLLPGATPTFLVAGPPPMVAAMYRVLDDLEVPRERVMAESFGALDSPTP